MFDLLKLLGVLALIVALLRLGWNLGPVLLLASVLTGLLYGVGLSDLLLDMLGATIDPLTLELVAIVLFITYLGEILGATRKLEGLVRSLSDLVVDPRWLLALMPMLIGMLPVAGGAMFSAPMVQEVSQRLDISPERRTFLNYWFRHTLEGVFPLYPGLVLVSGLLGLSVQTIISNQYPLFLAAIAGGLLFGMLGIRRPTPTENGRPAVSTSLMLLTKSIWPIALVLVLSIALKMDLVLALAITLVALAFVERQKPRALWDLLRRMPLGTVPVIVGAMVFRSMLETSHAVESMSVALGGLGIPVAALLFLVPFAAGLLTGLVSPAFAIGFPIVLPLCGVDMGLGGCGILMFAGGLVGVLVSPLHLCLALTRVYFQASWGGIYRFILPSALLIALTAFGVALLGRGSL